jgi:putative DNA primase/helicase
VFRTIDAAIKRRVNLLPFDIKIPDEEIDKRLGDKLRAEWPQILWWMIEGCLLWQRHGLTPPAAIIDATSTYLEQEDTFHIWLDECCVKRNDAVTPVAWLFHSWKRWAERAGEYVESERRFNQRFQSDGFKSGRTRIDGKLSRVIFGVELVPNQGTGTTDRDPECSTSAASRGMTR